MYFFFFILNQTVEKYSKLGKRDTRYIDKYNISKR